MFDFLKKKLSGWIGKGEEEKKAEKKTLPKKADRKKETAKKASKKEVVKGKAGKKEEKKIKKTEALKKEAREEEIEVAAREEAPKFEQVQETPEEKAGFFSRLFKKKGDAEARTEEKVSDQRTAIPEAKSDLGGQRSKSLEAEVTEETSEEIPARAEEDLEIKEAGRLEEEPKEEGFFRKLIGKMSTSGLTPEQFDEIFMELELTLLESNVALEAVDKIRENLAKSLVGQQFKKSEAEKKVIGALKESILNLLIEPENLIETIKKKDGIFTILFFGINGTGKTTSIAKIAHLFKKNKISCVLAAADTFRAASIEQLKTHGERIGVPVISSNYGADPASVAFEAKKYAQTHGAKVVLIDTAGRMYTKENLLKEMEKIIRISQPDLKIFVGESITGNDAVEQARAFNESAGIDGIILSKADIDEKAGAILSVSHVTGKPIYFLGTGQEYEDLEIFSKKTVLKNLGLE